LTKIFITIPWFLPAFRAGGPIQSVANLVREFNEDVEFYIFCGDTDLNGVPLRAITAGKWISYNDHTKVWYASKEKLSDNLTRQVDLTKPDILYVIGIFSWHFNVVPIVFCKVPKTILSARGMLHPGALSQKRWKKKIFLKTFRLLGLPKRIQVHATNKEEEKYIRKNLGSSTKVMTAGNFPNTIGALSMASKIAGSLKMISIALISPMKNILMVLQSLKDVKSNIQYDIYGPSKDQAYVNECLELAKCLPSNISVLIHGDVEPERVQEILKQAHVFVLPSKSENFGHAIYEALSAGRPVITSNFTPWNHLHESIAGINVSLDNTEELTNAISFFSSMDEKILSQWSLGALDYAAKAVDVENIRGQYTEMFTQSI
jgi:glycosyltransferase involved in cell wall biosynthesis